MIKIEKKHNNKNNVKYYIMLHLIFFQSSIGGIVSKLTARKQLFSFDWFFLYGFVLLNLFIYALFWQQIIKKFSLSTAFLNKSITIIWSSLWGFLFFNEPLTLNMLIGVIIVVIGISLVVTEHE